MGGGAWPALSRWASFIRCDLHFKLLVFSWYFPPLNLYHLCILFYRFMILSVFVVQNEEAEWPQKVSIKRRGYFLTPKEYLSTNVIKSGLYLLSPTILFGWKKRGGKNEKIFFSIVQLSSGKYTRQIFMVLPAATK